MKHFSASILAAAVLASAAAAQEDQRALSAAQSTCAQVTEAILSGQPRNLTAAMVGGVDRNRAEFREQIARMELQAITTIAFTQGLLRGEPVAEVETVATPLSSQFITQISRASTGEGQEAYVVCAAGRSDDGRLFHNHSSVQPTREAALESLNRYLSLVQAVSAKPAKPREVPI